MIARKSLLGYSFNFFASKDETLSYVREEFLSRSKERTIVMVKNVAKVFFIKNSDFDEWFVTFFIFFFFFLTKFL